MSDNTVKAWEKRYRNWAAFPPKHGLRGVALKGALLCTLTDFWTAKIYVCVAGNLKI